MRRTTDTPLKQSTPLGGCEEFETLIQIPWQADLAGLIKIAPEYLTYPIDGASFLFEDGDIAVAFANIRSWEGVRYLLHYDRRMDADFAVMEPHPARAHDPYMPKLTGIGLNSMLERCAAFIGGPLDDSIELRYAGQGQYTTPRGVTSFLMLDEPARLDFVRADGHLFLATVNDLPYAFLFPEEAQRA